LALALTSTLPAQQRDEAPRAQVEVPRTAPQPAAPQQPLAPQPAPGATIGVDQSAPAGHAWRAKEVLGARVHVEQNNEVGTVDDLVIDDQGNVDYVLVTVSSGQLVTIPWDAVQFNSQERIASVQITQDKFKAIPTYTVQQYPVFTAPSYRTQTYHYFGLTPGERRAIRRSVR
jgi:hypothetical protein